MSICTAAGTGETDANKFTALKLRYFDKDAVIVETFRSEPHRHLPSPPSHVTVPA